MKTKLFGWGEKYYFAMLFFSLLNFFLVKKNETTQCIRARRPAYDRQNVLSDFKRL